MRKFHPQVKVSPQLQIAHLDLAAQMAGQTCIGEDYTASYGQKTFSLWTVLKNIFTVPRYSHTS
jgi:hypothetical protein